MNILIFLLSTIIMVTGIIGFYRRDQNSTPFGIVLTLSLMAVFANGIDVFIDGDLTTFRQVTYLVIAVVIFVCSMFGELKWHR